MSLRTVPTAAICLTAFLWAAPALAGACALSGDAEEGAKVANACKGCHALEADAKPRPTGPNLHEVIGRKAGTEESYKRYSKAMKTAAEGGLVWSEAEVAAYVQDPKAYFTEKNGKALPHGMFFQLKDAEKAKQVAAFLAAIHGNADCP